MTLTRPSESYGVMVFLQGYARIEAMTCFPGHAGWLTWVKT